MSRSRCDSFWRRRRHARGSTTPTALHPSALPYTPGAWIDGSATKIGYEISFTRHFYKPQPLRSLEEISADILALEKETEGLLGEIVKGGGK
jgi:hypothetical protein